MLLLRSRLRRRHRIVLSLTRLRSVIPLWAARSLLLLVARSLLLLVARSLLLLVVRSLLLIVARSQTRKLSSFVRK